MYILLLQNSVAPEAHMEGFASFGSRLLDNNLDLLGSTFGEREVQVLYGACSFRSWFLQQNPFWYQNCHLIEDIKLETCTSRHSLAAPSRAVPSTVLSSDASSLGRRGARASRRALHHRWTTKKRGQQLCDFGVTECVVVQWKKRRLQERWGGEP